MTRFAAFRKYLFVTALAMVLLAAGEVRAGTTYDFFAGGGMERSALKLTTANSSSSFTGWGGDAEAGVVVRFSDTFGMLLSGEFSHTVYENSGNNKSFSESAKLDSVGGKLGFMLNRFAIGGGTKSLSLQVDGVTNSGQYDSVKYSGQSPFVFASFSIRAKDNYQATIEGQYGTADFGDVKATNTVGTLRFYILY